MTPLPMDQDAVYRVVFERASVAIFVLNSEQELVLWNRCAEFLTGFTAQELPLRVLSSLFPSGEWERLAAVVTRAPMQHHCETRMVRKDGRFIDVDVASTVLRQEDGAVNGFIIMVADITKRKAVETVLSRAKAAALRANRTKGAFLSTLSKDLEKNMQVVIEGIRRVRENGGVSRSPRDMEETYEAARQLDERIRGFCEAFRALKEEGPLPSSSDEDRE